MEPDYVTFENTFVEGPDELDEETRESVRARCAIDGFPASDDADGTVICSVYLLHTGKFLVDWHHNGYRMNPDVLGLIESTKAMLLEAYPDPDDVCDVLIFPYVEFDDGTATICKYHGTHDKPLHPGIVPILLNAVKTAYAQMGKTVTAVRTATRNQYEAYAASHGEDAAMSWDGKHAVLSVKDEAGTEER